MYTEDAARGAAAGPPAAPAGIISGGKAPVQVINEIDSCIQIITIGQAMPPAL